MSTNECLCHGSVYFRLAGFTYRSLHPEVDNIKVLIFISEKAWFETLLQRSLVHLHHCCFWVRLPAWLIDMLNDMFLLHVGMEQTSQGSTIMMEMTKTV